MNDFCELLIKGLLLDYEESLIKVVSSEYFNLSAHMLWIGYRTNQLKGAHMELFSGIANPLGLKIGPNSTEE